MNKDVIYIEPDDDITDIIAKIEKTKEKIVALVPPKKAGVFRSIVNVKLISKAGAAAEKSVVLVTVDPSIIKLAAATKMPVAKNLQSAPVIPTPETEIEKPAAEQNIEDLSENKADPSQEEGATENHDGVESSGADKSSGHNEHNSKDSTDEDEEDDDDSDEDNKKSNKKKGKKSPKLTGNKLLDWIKLHKKLTIFGVLFILALIGFLVWAFVFAPAVDISVAIKTDSKNFSEGITFTDKLTDENAKEGKFYLEQKKLENTQEVNFEATGQKNEGEKATGTIKVSHAFYNEGSVPINQGTIFSINGLNYAAAESVSLDWGGLSSGSIKESLSKCSNNAAEEDYCVISGELRVVATEGGTKYNIAPTSSGWSSVVQVSIRSDNPMSGGTDDIKTVVQQSDIEKAKGELTTAKEEENKTKLYESIGDEYYIIDSSFNQTTSNTEATPGADQEVTGSTKPVLKATTTATVYVVNKDKMKEFVKAKADLEDDQKVYDVKDIYVENFTNNEADSTAKMKAQYYIGPKITETEVVDKVKGKGLGDAQREIRDIYGVSDVKINTSYPWVMTVPGDTNKVKVTFEVKDQDGKEVKTQDESSTDSKDTEDKDKNKD